MSVHELKKEGSVWMPIEQKRPRNVCVWIIGQTATDLVEKVWEESLLRENLLNKCRRFSFADIFDLASYLEKKTEMIFDNDQLIISVNNYRQERKAGSVIKRVIRKRENFKKSNIHIVVIHDKRKRGGKYLNNLLSDLVGTEKMVQVYYPGFASSHSNGTIDAIMSIAQNIIYQ